MIGDKGLTDAVMREIDDNLNSHELIKVRVASDDRAAARCWLWRASARRSTPAPVQHIGKVLVLYRENPSTASRACAQSRPGARPDPAARRVRLKQTSTRPARTRR